MRLHTSHAFGSSVLATIFFLAPGIRANPTPLEDFPSASQIWLCYVKGSLAPTKEEAIISEGAGTIRILKENNSFVEKGQNFAVFRPELLELEYESLILERTLLTTGTKEARLEQEESLMQLEGQKTEIHTQLQELEAAIGEEEVRRDPKLRQRLQEAIAIIREQIERLDAHLEIQKAKASDGLEIQKLNLEHERREQDFKATKNRAESSAPFSGYFTLSEDLAAEHGEKKAPYEFWIESAETIGRITDKSSYEVELLQFPTILNQVPLEQLVLELQTTAAEPPLTALFLESRSLSLSGAGGRGERALIFQVRPAERKRAEEIAGSTPLGQVFLELPPGCHLVPKADLMRLLDGKEKQSGGWAGFARSIWPDAELVATGHLHLALRKNDPDQTSESMETPQPKPASDR